MLGDQTVDTTNTLVSQSSSKKSKFHHFTVCMVPPEESHAAWELLTKARADLRDPGLFRWPPHANLLYPFLDPYIGKDEQEIKEESSSDIGNFERGLDSDILDALQRACRQCKPFQVQLKRLGTFGGTKRGVLWVYPSSFRTAPDDRKGAGSNQTEPLVELQQLLEEQLPDCNDQRKVGGTYSPHMTLSHFPDLNAALEGQEQTERMWPEDIVTFPVDEIYLLHRNGDNGQFMRLASLGIGPNGKVALHQPNLLPFSHMPTVEADWVKDERMKLKARRNYSGGRKSSRGGRRRRSRHGPWVPDSPEVIAAKRAERKAKREASDAAVQDNTGGL
jgi:2'-5' RNA ligase